MASDMVSRRQVLGFMGALASVSVVSSQVGRKSTGKIDVHHHIIPPGANAGAGLEWSPALAIEEMDRNGVAAGIGFPGPIPFSADLEGGRKLARSYNEYGARLGADHPGRFGLFASLPMHDIDGSLKAVEYALDTLKADGFGISTSYGDMWLG